MMTSAKETDHLLAKKKRASSIKFDGGGLPTRSYSITANGELSQMNPLQMGREELYEEVPYYAVYGLQKKERNLSQAFSEYAAELDVMETEKLSGALPDDEKCLRKSRLSMMIMDELDADKGTVTLPLMISVLVATLAAFLNGYSIGVFNAPEKVVFPHTIAEWSLAVSAFALGGPFGAGVGGNLADTYGRRGALLIGVFVFFIGGLLQTFAQNMVMLTASRFIIGCAVGISPSVAVPIYLGELAPPNLRGVLGTLTQFGTVVGILASDILAFPFATAGLWRYLFSVTPIIAVLQLCLSPFLLESPRWLLSKNPESAEAKKIIRKLRGFRYDYEVETEVNHYLAASKAQAVKGDGSVSSKGSLSEIMKDESLRLLFVSSVVLQVGQQFSGINAVFFYSNMFFDGVVENPLVATVILGAVNVFFVYVALLMMNSFGRRTLILISAGGMFVCCVVLIVALNGYLSNNIALLAVTVYVALFEIGLGPIPWLIVAEMFDAKYVSTAMSACSQVNLACSFIVGLVFPYFNEYLGPYSFAPFAVTLLIVFLYCYMYLPETQGTSPQELLAKLKKKNNGTVYHNMSISSNYGTPIANEWQIALEQLEDDDEEK